MYKNYKNARDMAWKTLIECNITSLPINLQSLTNKYNIQIDLYSQSAFVQLLKPEVLDGDGFIISDNDTKRIFINDKINNRNRRRFTLAHEIGHGILNHPIEKIHYRNSELNNTTDVNELEANIFARDILMPACVLKELNVTTINEIMQLCQVSKVSASIRLERLKLLYKRNCFYKNKLEEQVLNQFLPYINSLKNKDI